MKPERTKQAALAAIAFMAVLAVFFALGAAGAAKTPLQVAIASPGPGEPIFGDTEIRAQVRSGSPIRKVEFYLDGLRVGLAEAPPFRVLVDAGQANVEHTIEVVAYDASGATATASLRTASIQSDLQLDVSLRQLFVSVERDGKPVPDLTKDDFTVVDQGARQTIANFARGDIPFTAVLLLDASSSMQGPGLEAALAGADNFARSMKRLDETKLVLFSDRILLETPFTNTPTILTLGLQNVEAVGGTAVNDALYLAFKRLEPRTGRKVLIVLSDGVDMESVLTMERVRALSRRDPVVVYWLRIQRGPGTPYAFSSWWRDTDEHRHELNQLSEMVAESGGRIQTIQKIEEVKPELTRILQELRDQYVLGYFPTNAKKPGTWHDVEVRSRARNIKVRTHRGYYE